MAPARDYLKEILERRARLAPDMRLWDQVWPRLSQLDSVRKDLRARAGTAAQQAYDEELARYLPIGYVACIEGFFRLVCQELIDEVPDCRQRTPQFRDLKMSLEHVVAMHDKKLTLGEFVSHLLPLGSLDDINGTLSTLTGADFLNTLKTVDVANPGQPARTLSDPDVTGGVYAGVKELFRFRHIFAHELAAAANPSMTDILAACDTAAVFIGFSAVYLVGLVQGSSPA